MLDRFLITKEVKHVVAKFLQQVVTFHLKCTDVVDLIKPAMTLVSASHLGGKSFFFLPAAVNNRKAASYAANVLCAQKRGTSF